MSRDTMRLPFTRALIAAALLAGLVLAGCSDVDRAFSGSASIYDRGYSHIQLGNADPGRCPRARFSARFVAIGDATHAAASGVVCEGIDPQDVTVIFDEAAK